MTPICESVVFGELIAGFRRFRIPATDRRVVILVLGLSVLMTAGACSVETRETTEPLSPHLQIRQLESEMNQRRAADDLDGAVVIVRRMLEIDSDHPLPYLLAMNLYTASRDYDAAEELLVDLGSEGPGLTFGQARLKELRKDYDEAETLNRDALAQYQAIDHLAGQGFSHSQLARVLQTLKRSPEDAIAEAREARAAFDALEDPVGAGYAMTRQASLVARATDLDTALPLYREAIALFAEAGDPTAESYAWQRMGYSLRQEGRPDEAIEPLQRALELRRATGNESDEFATLRELATAVFKSGRHDEAFEAGQEIVALAERIGSPARAAKFMTKMGNWYNAIGRYDRAGDAFRFAVELSRQAESTVHEAGALYSLGLTFLDSGRFAQSAEAFQSALALPGASKIKEAWYRMGLAQATGARGNFTSALLLQQRALELFAEEKSDEGELAARGALAATYQGLGALEISKRYVLTSLDLSEKLEDRAAEAVARNNLGVILREEGKHELALAEHQRSIELREGLGDPRGTAFSRYLAGDALRAMGRFREASRQLDLALEGFLGVKDVDGQATTLNAQGLLLFEQGKDDVALIRHEEAIAVASEHEILIEVWTGHSGRAAVFERAGKTASAAREYAQAIQVIETQRGRLETDEFKMRYLANKAGVYDRAIALQSTLEPEPATQTFGMVERARARGLADLLAESGHALRSSLPEELAGREQALVDEASAAAFRLADATSDDGRSRARRELADADERLQRLKLEIHRAAPEYSAVVYPDPIGLRALQSQVLAPDETLLRYFVGAGQVMLWMVDREGASFHRLGSSTDLEKLVAAYLDRAGRARVGRNGDEQAEALGEALLPTLPPPNHRLLVVPDGPLHHVPFDALRRAQRYVIEDHEVVVVPSATTLQILRGRPGRVARSGFLGVGDPLMPKDDKRSVPLPYSSRALERIAGLFPEAERRVLERENCTKSKLEGLKLDRFRYVHFATHGWLDRDAPRYYGLRLTHVSGDPAGDFLRVDDVLRLEFRAELVSLSACQSGSGEQLRGEGLVGLSRAFLHAGARSLLVTLWNINDRSTAEFSEHLYGELVRGRTVPDALRRTKLAFIRSERPAQRQPYRWAPFILIGDPGGSDIRSNLEGGRETIPALKEG